MIYKEENVIKEKWDENADVLVSIRCTTYNHERYIARTLEGFLAQETDFPFEIIIHDDASTDNTKDIISRYRKRYPTIIYSIFEETNQYDNAQKTWPYEMLEKARGKYIALCEGDDYWIDSKKLSKQVHFLEENRDYSMCYHPVYYVENDVVVGNDIVYKKLRDVPVEEIIFGGGLFCSTCSIVCKKSEWLYEPKFRKMADIGDYPLQIQLGLGGKVKYFPEVMGCYRLFSSASWSSAVYGNNERLVKHYDAEKAWLNELNVYTKGKYQDFIKGHLILYKTMALKPRGVAYGYRELIRDLQSVKGNTIRFRILGKILKFNIKEITKKYLPVIRKIRMCTLKVSTALTKKDVI